MVITKASIPKSLLGEWQNYRHLGVTIVSSPTPTAVTPAQKPRPHGRRLSCEVGNPGRPNLTTRWYYRVQAVPGGWHRFKPNNYPVFDRGLRRIWFNASTRQQQTLSALIRSQSRLLIGSMIGGMDAVMWSGTSLRPSFYLTAHQWIVEATIYRLYDDNKPIDT